MKETLRQFIVDLQHEIDNLRERRLLEIDSVRDRLTREVVSEHLGHNLGGQAHEITELNAKIYQTEMIKRDILSRFKEAL